MSVRKREWTTTRGEERSAWVLDYRDRGGKRRIETFQKKKHADARAAEVATDIRAGIHVPRNTSITVAQAGQNWIAESEKNGLERGTLAQYCGHLDNYIMPYLGHERLSDLTGPQVAAFERELHKDGASDTMRRKVLVSLSSILRLAMREGHVNRNVADGHRVKTNKRAKRKLKAGVDIPTPAEIRAFLATLEGRWRPFFIVAVFTGMRSSELRGLNWNNVDLKRGEIHVRERADAFHEIGHPKSEAGERTIPIGPIVINGLKQWRLQCPKSRLGLVFPTSEGGVHSASNIRRRALVPAMIRAGVVDKRGNAKYTGLHALRHFHASWLINPKELGGRALPPKVVQERLGHSALAMTMDTYGHLFPRDDSPEELRDAELALIA